MAKPAPIPSEDLQKSEKAVSTSISLLIGFLAILNSQSYFNIQSPATAPGATALFASEAAYVMLIFSFAFALSGYVMVLDGSRKSRLPDLFAHVSFGLVALAVPAMVAAISLPFSTRLKGADRWLLITLVTIINLPVMIRVCEVINSWLTTPSSTTTAAGSLSGDRNSNAHGTQSRSPAPISSNDDADATGKDVEACPEAV